MATNKETAGMEVPSHRACAWCRSQKIRCIMDDENTEACQRCLRSGRQCVFTAVAKRKQRKRTDTRVAELEREMKAMRAMLKDKQKSTGPLPQDSMSGARAVDVSAEEISRHRPVGGLYEEFVNLEHEHANATDEQQKEAAPFVWPKKSIQRPLGDTQDVIERGLISMATARQLFDSYRTDLFPHYPMVYVSPSVSADSMREAKPMLFLAILAAAAAKSNPELSAMLDQEVLHAYAAKGVVHSEKSVELVQSLLLSSVWYHPPNKFGQLKYYEYIHMAAMMALDIGIGSRPAGHRSRFGSPPNRGRPIVKSSMHPLEDAMNPDLSMTPRSRKSSPDTGNIESRRTFLACYIICAAVAMSLRRPNMLRVNSYIRESVEYLERSSDAVPSDRIVVAWVRLIIIQDEIGTSFAYDDPGGIASITEMRVQLMLKDLDRRLAEWRASTPDADMTGALFITYYTARLYLYEVALHVDHSPEDFKAPYQMGVIEPWHGEEIPWQVLAEAISQCISTAHSLLDIFLAMDAESLRAFPVFSFVRVSFAAFVLAKLCLSAAHPDSRIGRVLDRSHIKAEEYLQRLITHIREVVGSVRSRVPAIFLALLFKLRAWCLHPEMIEWSGGEGVSKAMAAQTVMTKPSPMSALAEATFEGPRVVEHSSGDESSPQTLGDRTANTNAGDPEVLNHSWQVLPGPTIESAYTSGLEADFPIDSALDPLNHHMELDSSFMNYFGDINGLAQGGLTGLDDWNNMPTDLMESFDGTFGYQFTPGYDVT